MAAAAKLVLVSAIIAAFFVETGLARNCRSGFESPYVYFYYKDHPCNANQTACFQSVVCDYAAYFGKEVNYKWACFNAADCKNTTQGSFATFEGKKGTCCFKDNCNAYKGNCTVHINSGTSIVLGYLPSLLGVSLAVFYFF